MTQGRISSLSRHARRRLTARASLFLIAAVAAVTSVGLTVLTVLPALEQEGSLRRDTATGRLGGEASLPLFVATQQERRETAVYLAHPTGAAKERLAAQRERTDRAEDSFRRLSGSELKAEQRHKFEHVEGIYSELEKLDRVRDRVDARKGKAEASTGYYTGVVERLIRFYQALSAMEDPGLTLETRPLVGLFYAADALAKQDMVIAQADAAGYLTAGQREAFADAYGTQKSMYQDWSAPDLPARDRATYERIVSSSAWTSKRRVERAVFNSSSAEADVSAPSTGGTRPAVLPADAVARWESAYPQLAQSIAALNKSRTQGLLAHGDQRADEIRTEVYVKLGTTGTVALLLSGFILWLGLTLAADLRDLQQWAEGGSTRLTQLIPNLRAGDALDVEAVFPDEPAARADFRPVTSALVRGWRLTAATCQEQARQRSAHNTFMSGTNRRTLSTIHQGLALMHGLMERFQQPEPKPITLQELICADQPLVRTRRFCENLGVLIGQRGQLEPYREPLPLVDLVNDAAVETVAADRVENQVTAHMSVTPGAVQDLTHLISELLENGLAASADGQATVRTREVVHGVALDVVDAGRGLSEEERARLNQVLGVSEDEAPFDEQAVKHGLGIPTVGVLARRHGIRVQLEESFYGGTHAVVMLPRGILLHDIDEYASESSPAGPHRRKASRRPEDASRPRAGAGLPPQGTPRAAQAVSAHQDERTSAQLGPPNRTSAGPQSSPVPEDAPASPPQVSPPPLPQRQRRQPRQQAQEGSSATHLATPSAVSAEDVQAGFASFQVGVAAARRDHHDDEGQVNREDHAMEPQPADPGHARRAPQPDPGHS